MRKQLRDSDNFQPIYIYIYISACIFVFIYISVAAAPIAQSCRIAYKLVRRLPPLPGELFRKRAAILRPLRPICHQRWRRRVPIALERRASEEKRRLNFCNGKQIPLAAIANGSAETLSQRLDQDVMALAKLARPPPANRSLDQSANLCRLRANVARPTSRAHPTPAALGECARTGGRVPWPGHSPSPAGQRDDKHGEPFN